MKYGYSDFEIILRSKIIFTAKPQSSQRVFILIFFVDPPKSPADRKDAKIKNNPLRI